MGSLHEAEVSFRMRNNEAQCVKDGDVLDSQSADVDSPSREGNFVI